MAALYGNAWTSQYGDDPSSAAAQTWASALGGLTAAQLAEGLRACVADGREFPPSAPRFRAMCLGIPTLAQVKVDLLSSGGGRAPFTVLVWRYVDAFAFRQADQRKADCMLADAYDIAREKVMRGEPLPAPVSAAVTHEPRKPVPATPEEAARHLREVRELLGNKETDEEFVSAVKRDLTLTEIEEQLREHYARQDEADEGEQP